MKLEESNKKIHATSLDLQAVALTLKVARAWGLEAEVMWSALNAAAEANEHGRTMEEVLEEALGEWDLNEEGMGQ